MKVQTLFFVFVSIMFVLFGCGADEDETVEVSDSDKTPIVSFEKLGEKITDGILGIEYRVVSDSKPKNDLLVHVDLIEYHCRLDTREAPNISSSSNPIWVTIPKGENKSRPVIHSIYFPQSKRYAKILPLPLIDIVGEGIVVNQELLHDSYVSSDRLTEEGKEIPEDYVFSYYEVADADPTLLYVPKPAKIISIDPANGSFINYGDSILITFDNSAECPRLINVISDHGSLGINYANLPDTTVYDVYLIVSDPFRRGRFPIKFQVATGTKDSGNEVVSEEFNYEVIR